MSHLLSAYYVFPLGLVLGTPDCIRQRLKVSRQLQGCFSYPTPTPGICQVPRPASALHLVPLAWNPPPPRHSHRTLPGLLKVHTLMSPPQGSPLQFHCLNQPATLCAFSSLVSSHGAYRYPTLPAYSQNSFFACLSQTWMYIRYSHLCCIPWSHSQSEEAQTSFQNKAL